MCAIACVIVLSGHFTSLHYTTLTRTNVSTRSLLLTATFKSVLDHNPMSPVPRDPVTTIVERTGKKLRAVIFDGGSPSPDVSRTVHIPHENSNNSWKKQLKFRKLYRDRSPSQPTSVNTPVSSSTTADDNAPAYDGPDLTPVKFRRMSTFTARQNIIMAAAQHAPAKMILDSGAGISGVGEQWKLTDISRMSSMSIQGACGHHFKVSLDVGSSLPY